MDNVVCPSKRNSHNLGLAVPFFQWAISYSSTDLELQIQLVGAINMAQTLLCHLILPIKNTGKQVHSENSHVYDTDRCREPHCKPVATMSIKSEQSAKSSTFVGHFRHQPRVMPLHLFLAPARLPLLPLQLRASALSGETQQTKEVRAGSHSLVTVQFFLVFHGVWFWGDSRTHRCTEPSAYKTIITLLHDLQLRIVKRHECGSSVYNKYSTKPRRCVALALDQHKAQQKELLKINNGLHQSANSAPLCANLSWPVDNRIMQSYGRHFSYSTLSDSLFLCSS